ncbi:putative acyl-CoA dehydrogenase FadE32 [Mycobacterium kansasii 824]|nr:putative acyl-CoA dehydrogenase FadE32 [Mycobacterium kansasii 824]
MRLINNNVISPPASTRHWAQRICPARFAPGRRAMRRRPQGVAAIGQPWRHRTQRAGEVRRSGSRSGGPGGRAGTARPLVCARPVTESIAVAPVLLANDDQAERCAGLAAGELIATVALPPQVPRAVDADTAGLVLLAGEAGVAEGTPGQRHASVDPSRHLYDVAAAGQTSKPGKQTSSAPTNSAYWLRRHNW